MSEGLKERMKKREIVAETGERAKSAGLSSDRVLNLRRTSSGSNESYGSKTPPMVGAIRFKTGETSEQR